ncbi:MAG: hypothetical protein H6600_01575 [Flavobacteriales bacterium]|nr:hypothetical protein [Flavobacteriales bacterium]
MFRTLILSILFLQIPNLIAQSNLDSLFEESTQGVSNLIEFDFGTAVTHGPGLHFQYGRSITDRLKAFAGFGIFKPNYTTIGFYTGSKLGPTLTLDLRRYTKRYDPLHFSLGISYGIMYRFTYNKAPETNNTGATRSITNSLVPYFGYGLFWPKIEICANIGIGAGASSIDFNDDLVSPSIYRSNNYPKQYIAFEFGIKLGVKF